MGVSSDFDHLETVYFSLPVWRIVPVPLNAFQEIFTEPAGVSRRNGRLPSPKTPISRLRRVGSAVEAVTGATGRMAPDLTNTGMFRVSAAMLIVVPPETALPVHRSNHRPGGNVSLRPSGSPANSGATRRRSPTIHASSVLANAGTSGQSNASARNGGVPSDAYRANAARKYGISCMRQPRISRQRPSSSAHSGNSSFALFFLRSKCFHGGFRMYQPLIIARGEKTTDCKRRKRSSWLLASLTSGHHSKPQKLELTSARTNCR